MLMTKTKIRMMIHSFSFFSKKLFAHGNGNYLVIHVDFTRGYNLLLLIKTKKLGSRVE